MLRRAHALWLLSLLTGCDRIFNLQEVKLAADGGGSDAGGDGGVGCYGTYTPTGFLSFCPQGAEVLDPWMEDDLITTGGADVDCEVVMEAAGGDVCLIVAETISIAGTVNTFGGRPLILLATRQLTITGTLRVDGLGVTKGPGADPMVCNSLTFPNPNGASGSNLEPGGGGGAGGSFGTAGALAGDGAGLNMGGNPLAATPDAIELRGGCDGGTGGVAIGGTGTRPRGGNGGGAVYLIAGDQIAITNGIINASGGGGEGATLQAGGGGGGAGGMIVLDAPDVVLQGASLIARGGGGGGGACASTNGQPGQGASPTTFASPGGTGGTGGGGEGGRGAENLNALTGQDGGAACGGGGGGGGHGIIRIATPNLNVVSSLISPPQHP